MSNPAARKSNLMKTTLKTITLSAVVASIIPLMSFIEYWKVTSDHDERIRALMTHKNYTIYRVDRVEPQDYNPWGFRADDDDMRRVLVQDKDNKFKVAYFRWSNAWWEMEWMWGDR